MEIREVTGSVKKLGNNKFFLIAVVVVVIMSLISIIKKDNGSSTTSTGAADVEAVLNTYPSGGVSAANANMITESVNQQNRILYEDIMTALDDMEGSMIIQSYDQSQMLTESLEGLRSEINYESNKLDTIENNLGMLTGQITDQMESNRLQLSDQITTLGGQIMDRVDYNNMTVSDKLEQNLIYQDSQFAKLHDQLQADREYSNMLTEGIRGEIGNQNQLMNNHLNQVQEQIRNTERYLSQRQDLISDKIGGRS